MQLSMYEWVFIITSVFGAYTVYKFMTVFFETKNSHRKVELLSYIGYFLVISVIYLVVNIPIVLLIANLLALIGLTYNYQSAFKKRVLAVVFIYLIFMSVEMTVALITGYINFPLFSENNYSSIFGLIFSEFFHTWLFLSLIILQILKEAKLYRTLIGLAWC